MRKTALVVLLFLTLLARSGQPRLETAHAQGLTPIDTATVDSQLASVDSELARLQPGYILTTGRYLQVLATTDSPPDKDSPQDYNKAPSDVGISLYDLGVNLPADLSIKFAVHEYSGPAGPGYLVIAYTVIKGQVYRRIIHHGPDKAYQSTGWESYDPDE